jgi:hypothetical protein
MDAIFAFDLSKVDLRNYTEVADSIEELLNLRSLSAEDYLRSILLTSPELQVRVGDCDVSMVLNQWDLNVPDNLIHKTPDIFVYNRAKSMLYIGDVAVTARRSRHLVDAAKTNKYSPLIEQIATANEGKVRVHNVNYIECKEHQLLELNETRRFISESFGGLTLPNTNQLNSKFSDALKQCGDKIGILEQNSDYKLVKEELERRQRHTREPGVARGDRDESDILVQEVDEEREKSIFNWIFKRIGNPGITKQECIEKLPKVKTDLEAKNDLMESGKIKSPIPFVFNCNGRSNETGLELMK